MRPDINPLPGGSCVDGMPGPFEGLEWAILGQQIAVAFAAHLKNAVAERYGTMVEDAGGRQAVFSSASALSRATADELRGMKLSRQKAETLMAVAQAVAEGSWDLQDLYGMPSQEAYDALAGIKWIGPWTAVYCLLRVFGYLDNLPAGEVALRRA